MKAATKERETDRSGEKRIFNAINELGK